MEGIIQDEIHIYYKMHKAIILIKLEVLEVSHALIHVGMYRQACM